MISFIQINTTQQFFSWSIIMLLCERYNRLLGFKIECCMLLIDYLIQGTFIVACYCKVFWDNSTQKGKPKREEGKVFLFFQDKAPPYNTCLVSLLGSRLAWKVSMRCELSWFRRVHLLPILYPANSTCFHISGKDTSQKIRMSKLKDG